MLLLHPNIVDQMKSAVQYSDEECCGFLFGLEEEGSIRTITDVVPVQNVSVLNKKRTFEISSEDYMDAEEFAVRHDLQLLGVYHSHIHYPATPSEYDRVAAQPHFSYVILSVAHHQVDSIRSWTLNDKFKFEEESISIINIKQHIHGYRNHSNSAA